MKPYTRQLLLLSLILIGCSITLQAQQTEKPELVQLSGLVLDGSDENLIPIPYVNILVKGDSRGTYTDFKGFFSIVVEKGGVVEFSALGYKTVRYEVPKTLEDSHYSIVQLMTQDTINLPETVVFPWPSREHFKLEFLAMDVTPELQKYAAENMATEVLEKARYTVSVDGNENADFYLRQQASEYYYYGQQPPMNIFNPIAWKKFFDSWKNGDYKKKRDN